jgi:Na+-translocating ferredoxin:NAD+ oxidoreductase RNF subunit RnfB
MTMTQDPYQSLLTRLNYPDSERLRGVLENLLTLEQARIAAALPGTIEEAAQKSGLDAKRVEKELDALFYAGVVFPKGDYKDRQYFRFARSVGQLHDASQASKGRDVIKDRVFYQLWQDFLMHEWYPDMGNLYGKLPSPRSRIVPAYNAIKDLPDILPWEDIRELFKTQRRLAVVPCSCRYRTTAVDAHCNYTAEEDVWHCIQLNRGADYALAREAGRELNMEEAIKLIDQIEADGLLHIWGNHDSMAEGTVSCHCCRDCCMMAVPMDMAKLPLQKLWQKSRFIAVVDQEACNGCQTCVDRCQFDAIEMVKMEANGKSKKRKARVDPEACYGCGVCVLGCDKTHALSMKLVRPPDHIPSQKA